MTRRRLRGPSTPQSDDQLLEKLRSLDLRDRKDALQYICEALEAGFHIVPDQNLEFASLVAAQRNSSDPTVRRWFYKYVGLSRQAAYVPVLLDRVGEEDRQTAAWMIGALCAVLGVEPAREALDSRGVDTELLKHAPVFAAYFLPSQVDREVVRTLVAGDNDLLDRWASFLNVRAANDELTEFTRSLNSSEDAEVAEFSVWSAGRAGGLAGTSLQPDRIPELPPQVRRWAYHTVAADTDARTAYADLLWQAREKEPEERVREGLVAGLTRHPVERGWRTFLEDWGHSDESPKLKRLINDALKTSRAENGATILQLRGRRRTTSGEKGQGQMFGVPRIESTTRETVYILALDTVRFSESSDANQLRVVETFLNYLANDPVLLALQPTQLVPLFTGDGIFIGMRGASNARAPLEVALSMQADYEELYKTQMRIGLHCGTVAVLSMSDGSTQLIGHAINEAARVMTGAPDGGVTLSDAYWTDVLHRGRERLVGYAVTPREVEDKHGHVLQCHDVRPAG